ncbi:WD40 repeat-like protein [Gloeophyllum trabeum ATCC 11539]|uniref:WD40 repeat-like protein n=1 Tax=Gloeophyllum trabeum (strain ATCC 11539 / FP-39264 / Madison 617) TaxID=670483 RepID=S7QFV5_GLOTA|nr:WD40 repeat-like protein [Gloeophyllum trabeum ATCC 11539]EPQ58028.1 WD40 repeat-like protein [Gloeophyllum trabeum ATCC 11539]
MANSDLEDDDFDFDVHAEVDADADGDEDIDEDILDAVEAEIGADDATEGDEDGYFDDSDEGEEDEDEEELPEGLAVQTPVLDPKPPAYVGETPLPPQEIVHNTLAVPPTTAPSPPRERTPGPLSPAQQRRAQILATFNPSSPRSYTVEAMCAIPQPHPTHSLAASLCMTHLLTGCDDGYVRDYDIFAAVNGKNFLTAPQRHHCGVIEGTMKAGQLRFWWENPADPERLGNIPAEEIPLSPVYSLAMHSDALWALAGSDQGHINLFTVRHDPGRLCHVMRGHRGHVSALSIQHDEKGFLSAGWDGDAIHWDLNTGQITKKFTAHGAQLASIAFRPICARPWIPPSTNPKSEELDGLWVTPKKEEDSVDFQQGNPQVNGAPGGALAAPPQPSGSRPPPDDSDTKSDASFDPLFDDEPDGDGQDGDNASVFRTAAGVPTGNQAFGATSIGQSRLTSQPAYSRTAGAPAPRNAPPLLDSREYAAFSPDTFLTASVDGQVILWDARASPGRGVGRLWMNEKTPPWCQSACWSANGEQIYAGRRNGTVDIWDVRQMGTSGPENTPRLMKTLRNPASSGVVSCVVAFPDGRHLACASQDNIRLWNVAEAGEPDASGRVRSGAQFKIIPGHHGGYISQMLVDPAARFLVSASSNRGWHGDSTRTVFVHEIKHIQ